MFLNKENSFNAPEGEFRFKITDAKLTKDKYGREMVRIVGDLVSLRSKVYNYQAGTNYYGSEAEMLGHFESILGDEVDQVTDDNGQILPEGLQVFLGKECDVQIVHVHSKKHCQPYRKIAHLTRAGELVKWPA